MSIQSKSCRKCGETKPVADFYGKSRISDYPASSAGFSSQCRACVRERTANRRQRLGDEYKINFRDWEYKKKYGIGISDYNKMFELQGGCCGICGKHQTQFKRALAVDHSHLSGAVRSLLCVNCNLGIGSFRENIDVLRTAIEYLIKHSTTNVASAQVANDGNENGGHADDESVH